MEPTIHNIEVKSVLTKSNLPVADYSVNPYTGCEHGCKYCYASFMKRFTNHPEPWGTFVDIKHWPEIKHPEKYAGKELFIGSIPAVGRNRLPDTRSAGTDAGHRMQPQHCYQIRSGVA